MEWVLAKNHSQAMLEYHLMDRGNKRGTLKYNTHQQVARIQCEGHYGVFFIERHGTFINKTLFKNEYGQEIGKLSFDKRHSHTGPIELNGKKYHYSFQNNPFAELLIYDQSISSPLVSSGLHSGSDQGPVVFASVSNEEYCCFLLGLCWYLLSSVADNHVARPALLQTA